MKDKTIETKHGVPIPLGKDGVPLPDTSDQFVAGLRNPNYRKNFLVGTIEYAWNIIDRTPEQGDDITCSWDDLMYYDVSDFQSRFGTSEDDSEVLWMVVQSRVDPRRALDASSDPITVGTMIGEAQHQSFDGWSTAHRLVIEAFLSDIAWAMYNESDE